MAVSEVDAGAGVGSRPGPSLIEELEANGTTSPGSTTVMIQEMPK